MVCVRTLVLLAVAAIAAAPRARAADERPNIVFIYADDHAQRAVGAYGSPLTRTPSIDRLASGGMRFTNSYVANSICGPSRATILTGLHAHAHGKTTNGAGFRDELPTFARRLQAAGYQTAMVGKWHLSPDPSGFDCWAIARGGYYNPDLVDAEGTTRHEGYTTEVITDRALAWIEEERDPDRPFLVWLNHTASHRTWMPGPDYLTRYEGVELPEPATLFDDYRGRSAGAAAAQMRIARDLFPAYDLKLPPTGEGILDKRAESMLGRLTAGQLAAWRAAYDPRNEAFAKAGLEGDDLVRWKYQRYIRDYLRCVDALDDSVGRVLEFLEESGLDGNTIVIYSSDQGFFLGEHGWYDKRWMYEPSLATPLIVRWPGVTEAGSTCDAMVQNIDMAPTFVDLASAESLPGAHGASLVPLLEGRPPEDWRTAVYYHYLQRDSGRTSHTVAPHYGIRTERHKLMYVYDLGFWELYDLIEDPDEMHNLIADPQRAELIEELKSRLAGLREQYGDEGGKAF